MKKILALLTVVIFIFGTTVAQADVYSETHKTLNKIETTMNRVDNNSQTARNENTKENVKSSAKAEAIEYLDKSLKVQFIKSYRKDAIVSFHEVVSSLQHLLNQN